MNLADIGVGILWGKNEKLELILTIGFFNATGVSQSASYSYAYIRDED